MRIRGEAPVAVPFELPMAGWAADIYTGFAAV